MFVMFFLTQDLSAVEVYETQSGQLKHTIKLSSNENNYIYVRSLMVTNQHEGLIVISTQGTIYRDEEHVLRSALAVFDLRSDGLGKLAETETYGNAFGFDISADGSRVMVDVRPGGGFVKCIDVFDLSCVRGSAVAEENKDDASNDEEGKGVLQLVASLKPETDARFNYLTPDGSAVCVGLAGIDGISFFEKCLKKLC